MCGINFFLRKAAEGRFTLQQSNPKLKRRGPDDNGYEEVKVNGFQVSFEATVLHMRGETLVHQPLVSEKGNILLWNGEIFGGIKIDSKESDTSVLLQMLESPLGSNSVSNVVRKIKGPYAFLYFQMKEKMVWFGRDYFGRRSLLWKTTKQSIRISSVCMDGELDGWTEIPACGLFVIDLNSSDFALKCLPWLSFTSHIIKHSDMLNSNTEVQDHIQTHMTEKLSKTRDIVLDPVELPEQIDKQEPLAILQIYNVNEVLCPIHNRFLHKLQRAVSKRLAVCDASKRQGIGILFSGGIDCTVLAVLAHKCLPLGEKIDLVNVAFQQHGQTSNSDKSYMVPDRLTGEATFKELKTLFPQRDWRFIEVNVPVEELVEQRKLHIAQLAYPKDTVLDDSIACAIWFAARAKGKLHNNGSAAVDYTSTFKILLCGMGADEQLGGYSRHRGVFENSGWNSVDTEIKMEIERIASRNLGRDDRIISDHGKEALFPYLDEGVVGLLSKLPVHIKADLRLPRGVGEKILLRCVAYKLGLRHACTLPKRAIQFGSRIAKAEVRKEKGSDKCARLQLAS